MAVIFFDGASLGNHYLRTIFHVRFPGVGSVAFDTGWGVQASGSGSAIGISVHGTNITVEGNQLTAPAGTSRYGISDASATAAVGSNNVVAGLGNAIRNCRVARHSSAGNRGRVCWRQRYAWV